MIASSNDFNLTSQSVDNHLAQYDDNEGVSYHEFGHAVAAIILNVRFDHVSVIHSEENVTGGRVAFGEHPCDWRLVNASSIDHSLRYCIFLMAGMAAQLRWHGKKADLKACGSNDRDALDTACILIAAKVSFEVGKNTKQIGEDSQEVKIIKDWAWREACLMMANPRAWAAVCSLARHLYTSEQETAAESDVAEIVAAAKVCYRPTRGIAEITRAMAITVTSP
jgi:hypothetical protein